MFVTKGKRFLRTGILYSLVALLFPSFCRPGETPLMTPLREPALWAFRGAKRAIKNSRQPSFSLFCRHVSSLHRAAISTESEEDVATQTAHQPITKAQGNFISDHDAAAALCPDLQESSCFTICSVFPPGASKLLVGTWWFENEPQDEVGYQLTVWCMYVIMGRLLRLNDSHADAPLPRLPLVKLR